MLNRGFCHLRCTMGVLPCTRKESQMPAAQLHLLCSQVPDSPCFELQEGGGKSPVSLLDMGRFSPSPAIDVPTGREQAEHTAHGETQALALGRVWAPPAPLVWCCELLALCAWLKPLQPHTPCVLLQSLDFWSSDCSWTTCAIAMYYP